MTFKLLPDLLDLDLVALLVLDLVALLVFFRINHLSIALGTHQQTVWIFQSTVQSDVC